MATGNKLLHGARIRLYPSDTQAGQFDSWRRKCLHLWNLLLGMEQAAYSGEKFRPELRWRQIWAEVAQHNYELSLEKRAKKSAEGKPVGNPPAPPDLSRILPRSRTDGPPKLFIWENDLRKLMARLKKEPLTQWIGEIHSHAAQAICKDLVKAIQAMLRERSKANGRDWGFPRFKKTGAYAAGSVYFANTQIRIVDWQRRRITFPLGVGEMKMGRFGHIPEGAKLMGGRVYRIGEEWWLSAQFEYEAPEHLPKTGEKCGVKVAAKAVYTVWDGNRIHQTLTRETRRGIKRREKLAGRKLSRREKRSKNFYEAAGQVAQYYAGERNRRDDTIHKASRRIVDRYDSITIDKMNVSQMMAVEIKALRKVVRSAAMARAAHMISYKAEEAGRVVHETHVNFPTTQICSRCGTLNPQMKRGARLLVCIACGMRMQRQENAAHNQFEQGRIVCDASLALNRDQS